MVDDRHVQVLAQPMVGRRVQALAGDELVAQRGDVVIPHEQAVRVLLLHGAESRGGHKEAIHAVVLDDPPKHAGIRGAHRLALEEHRRAAAQQRAVNDVGVPDHPADVRGGPEHVARIDPVDGLHAPVQRHRMAAVVAHHALGLAGGAGGVEDVERVMGIHRHPVGAFAARLPSGPVEVPARRQRRLALRPLQHHAMGHRLLGQAQRLVEQGLVGDDVGHLDAAGSA